MISKVFLKPLVNIFDHGHEPGMSVPATVFTPGVVREDFGGDPEVHQLGHGREDL